MSKKDKKERQEVERELSLLIEKTLSLEDELNRIIDFNSD
jgi:hypothetical protein